MRKRETEREDQYTEDTYGMLSGSKTPQFRAGSLVLSHFSFIYFLVFFLEPFLKDSDGGVLSTFIKRRAEFWRNPFNTYLFYWFNKKTKVKS